MISPKECLVKVSYLLAVNGFNVVDITPQKHEYMALNYNKTDIYKSPVEFSANGVSVWLYGNVLVLNGELTIVSPFSVVDTYKAIANLAKRQKKTTAKPSGVVSTIARYIASMTHEAVCAA